VHRVLKSRGLQLEHGQVTTVERLEKLTAVAVKAAYIDIQLAPGRDAARVPACRRATTRMDSGAGVG
jgi:hypothetical protein